MLFVGQNVIKTFKCILILYVLIFKMIQRYYIFKDNVHILMKMISS